MRGVVEEVVSCFEDFGVCDLLDSLGVSNNFAIDFDILGKR